MNIQLSRPPDLDTIFRLFAAAVRYQEARGFDLWPDFSRDLIRKEMSENRHFKILEADEIIAVFSVQYADPVIWGEENINKPAVYLHRIAVHPFFKGQKLMVVIREWSLDHARSLNKKFVRMDTWGNNKGLRDYYISCGWPYIGQRTLTAPDHEPMHYGGNYLSLFELKV